MVKLCKKLSHLVKMIQEAMQVKCEPKGIGLSA